MLTSKNFPIYGMSQHTTRMCMSLYTYTSTHIVFLLITVPGAVSNIRAYVYKPTRGSDHLSALLVWEKPQVVVSNYIVSISQNDRQLFPPVSS